MNMNSFSTTLGKEGVRWYNNTYCSVFVISEQPFHNPPKITSQPFTYISINLNWIEMNIDFFSRLPFPNIGLHMCFYLTLVKLKGGEVSERASSTSNIDPSILSCLHLKLFVLPLRRQDLVLWKDCEKQNTIGPTEHRRNHNVNRHRVGIFPWKVPQLHNSINRFPAICTRMDP